MVKMGWFIAAIVAVQACASHARGDVVERRGGAPSLEGEITIEDAGVRVRTRGGAAQLVPWDRVRSVTPRPAGDDFEQRMKLAEELWRARSRLERGDYALAEGIFERHFELSRGRTDETALVIAEGLARCRLARLDPALALIPALEAARMRRAGINTESYRAMPALIDDATALCVQLPPAWLASPTTRRLEQELASYDARGDEVIASLASLYRQSIRQQMHGPWQDAVFAEPRGATARHPGVALLRDLVQAGAAEPGARELARGAIARLMDGSGDAPSAWVEAWGRYALGLSLLWEDEPERTARGAVHLLHLPARFNDSQFYLSGLAVAQVIHMLERKPVSSVAGASSLRAELDRRYSHHPVHSPAFELSSGRTDRHTTTENP